MVRYTQQMKDEIILKHHNGSTYKSLENIYGISSRTLAKWLNEFKDTTGVLQDELNTVKESKVNQGVLQDKHKTFEQYKMEKTISYNSRFLSWLGTLFQIPRYYNLSKKDLKKRIIHKINNI